MHLRYEEEVEATIGRPARTVGTGLCIREVSVATTDARYVRVCGPAMLLCGRLENGINPTFHALTPLCATLSLQLLHPISTITPWHSRATMCGGGPEPEVAYAACPPPSPMFHSSGGSLASFVTQTPCTRS